MSSRRSIAIAGCSFSLLEERGESLLIEERLLNVEPSQIFQAVARARFPQECDLHHTAGAFGRGRVLAMTIGQVPVVIRPLRRGGLVRFINRDVFFRGRRASALNLRPLRELVVLSHLRGAGAHVPEPMFALASWCKVPGGYRGALATRAIEGGRTLLELVRETPTPSDELLSQIESAGRAASNIVRLAVLHTDLHPGNVLVGKDGTLTIIDFDKARFLATRASEGEALKHLSNRWHRFVEKYGLPATVTHAFRGGVYGGYHRS